MNWTVAIREHEYCNKQNKLLENEKFFVLLRVRSENFENFHER